MSEAPLLRLRIASARSRSRSDLGANHTTGRSTCRKRAGPRPTAIGSPNSASARAPARSNRRHEPVRSSHSFALQRPVGGMAFPAVRFSRQLLRSAGAVRAVARSGDGFRHHDGPRHDRRLPSNRGSAEHFHQRAGYDIFSAGPVQDSFARLGHHRSAARRDRRAARQHFRSPKLPAKGRTSPTPSRTRSTASTASWRPRISSGSSCFSNISKASTACAMRCSAISPQLLLNGLTPEKIEELANRHGFAPTHAEPWKKILDRRLGRSRRAICRVGVHRDTDQARSRGRISRAHSRRAAAKRKGDGGTPLALSHGFYNTLSLFHSGPLQRTARAQRAAARDNVLALHGRAGSDGIHPARESDLLRAGRAVGKDFRAGQTGNISLWKELSGYFARPEVKARLADEIGRASPNRSDARLSWRIWSANSSPFGFSRNSCSSSAAAT